MEHANFIGTITVSPNVLTAMLEEIICLTKQGFKKFLVCTGHGGSYWEGAFIKHINFKYPNIIVITANHNNHAAWEEAVSAAGLTGLNEIHGGLLSVCTAMWLCPKWVKLHSMGSDVPTENRLYADYVGWDKLTVDGCWGQYEDGLHSQSELADKGKIFRNTFIQRRAEGLKGFLEEGYRRKVLSK
ncbi:creatininase family protein [Paenibacillus terricola]|uniref:creatininase family protein n=1 Tax=Paenibacillus terricola TaxID=2763503 RepID=UPI002963CD06|nr:creatininase family protein [Paenibacillus terricola]